jgi:hypothetical protein
MKDRHFIKREGDRLRLDGEEFRFVSFNTPNLHMMEDPDWHLPTAWEQSDTIRAVAEMGGRALRIYTLSVAPVRHMSHVEAPGKFNEEMFRCLDKALELCREYGVYMIIPFVDNSSWWGGVLEYAAFRGRRADNAEYAGLDTDETERRLRTAFYTDKAIRADFKATIEFLLNRTNVYTGVKYKDDPMILCWELGNEIWSAPAAWKREMAGFIKNIDGNHLIMDGAHVFDEDSLAVESIDILTAHYYERFYPDFAGSCRREREITKGKRPLVIGEFGLSGLDNCRGLIDEAAINGTAGVLLWALRSHSETGGFYFHVDGTSLAYHYPGFLCNASYHEREMMDLMRQGAAKVNGRETEIAVPDAPGLLAVTNGDIVFRGSTGAQAYDIFKASVNGGEFKLLAGGVEDCAYDRNRAAARLPIYRDDTSKPGDRYFIRAKNAVGASPDSNIIKA